MGLFEKIFGTAKAVKLAKGYFKTLTAYQPVFNSWKGGIYESQLCRASIDAIARNISKLKVEVTGSAKPALQTILRKAPNSWQTWTQFMYRLSTILYVDNTAFIVPVYNRFGDIVGIYPILPQRCEVVDVNNEPWLKYEFSNGQKASIDMASCGVMTRFQYDQDFFGADNRAMIPTLDLIGMQNQGIKEGIKNAATYRFMAQLDNFATDEDLVAERKKFSEQNLSGEGGGLLLMPSTYKNIQQLNTQPFVADTEQMKVIQTNVFNYFGVNEKILQNIVSGDEWNAFYEGCIEPFSIQFSEVLSRMLFTDFERGHGAGIIATANRLQYASATTKLQMSSQMLDRGVMTRNEVREMWNLAPIEGGDEFIIRGEYYDADEKLEQEESIDADQE